MSSIHYQPSPIKDYALIGNLRSAALVAKNGIIDWFCPTRFDNPACFAALVGEAANGYWRVAPADVNAEVSRRYLSDTLLLQTTFTTAGGTVTLLDYMPLHCGCHIVREVCCVEGSVEMTMLCQPGFHYGKHCGQVSSENGSLIFTATEGEAERIKLSSNAPLITTNDGRAGRAEFTIKKNEKFYFSLTHTDANESFTALPPLEKAAANSAAWWRDWIAQCTYDGPWKEAVTRSLIVLKAMTFQPTGAILAAPTTSLPEVPAGSANWDYRFTWLRDASLVLDVLLGCGFHAEAREWRNWLVDAVTRSDDHMKTLYTIEGSVSHQEQVLDWLAGYQGARPVRIGNVASRQFQLDLSGEVIQVLHLARKAGLEIKPQVWQLQCQILENIARKWREPDAGIWESRGEPQHYVHSKVLAWVAYDRSIQDAERYQLDAPLDDWRRARAEIHNHVCRHGVHADNYFVRYYGSDKTDASLLMIPLVGFLRADDPRVVKTIRQIEQQNCSQEGFVYRNPVGEHAGHEGTFTPCSYWLADNYMCAGRPDQAKELFERLLKIRNDVGLLAEEYDPRQGTFLGNFPQSFSHLGLINSARLIGAHEHIERSGDSTTKNKK